MSKKRTPLWREAHLEVKMHKTHQLRTTVEMSKKCTPLWREAHFEVEKVHAIVAQSTFRSQNVKKHQGFGPLLDVQMCFRVAGARDCGPCQKWAKREGFVVFSTATTTTPHYTPIHYTTTTATPSLHSTTLHYTPLRSATLHYTQLHSITLKYTQLHSITLHYTTLHYTTLDYIPLRYIQLPYTTLHYTTLHYPTLHYITLRYITLHSLHHHTCNCNYTTLITLHHTYNSTTLQLQLQLHHTTLHPAVVGEVTDQLTTATIASVPTNRHESTNTNRNEPRGHGTGKWKRTAGTEPQICRNRTENHSYILIWCEK